MTVPTPDYPDFTQPTASLEHDYVPFPYGNLATGAEITAAGAGQYQSAALRVDYPTAGQVGDRFAVLITMTAAGNFTGNDQITFHSSVSYPNPPGGFLYTFPILGDTVNVSLFGPAGRSAPMSLSLSTRAVAKSRLVPVNTIQYPLIGGQGLTSIAAGAISAISYVPPSDRAVSVRGNSGAPSGTYRINTASNLSGPAATAIPWEETFGAGTFAVTDIPVPRMGLEVVMVNNDTVAHNMSSQIVDVS